VSPWSSRAILAVSALVALASIPLWLDPVTLAELRHDSPLPPAATEAPPSPTNGATGSHASPNPVPGIVRVMAQDGYERDVPDGWGTAQFGGEYRSGGSGQALSVSSGHGAVSLIPDGSGSAVLPSAIARDVSMRVTVRVAAAASTGSTDVSLVLRRIDSRSMYRPAVHVGPGGEVSATIDMLAVGRAERLAGPVAIPELTGAPTSDLRVRADVAGSDPTTVSIRVWRAGEAEPADWQLSVVDWTGNLQGVGAIGVAWRLADAAPETAVTLNIDDLEASTTDDEEHL